MMLVEAEVDGMSISLVLQNAETVQLVNTQGNAVSVVDLVVDDNVLGHIEKAGRHFGMQVDETLIER